MHDKITLAAAVFGVLTLTTVQGFWVDPVLFPLIFPQQPPLLQAPPPPQLPPVAPRSRGRLPPAAGGRALPPIGGRTPARTTTTTEAPQQKEPVDYSVCYWEECDPNDRRADYNCAQFCYENKCTLFPPTPFFRQGSCNDRYCDCF